MAIPFDVPFNMLIFLVGFAVLIGIIGIILGLRKMAGSPFLTVFAGIIIFGQLVMIDDVIQGYSTNPVSNTVYHYDQQDTSGVSDICGAAGCAVVKGELVTNTASMLYNDVIDCVDVTLRKSGSPPISTLITVGIYDRAQAVSNPIIKTIGTMNVTNISGTTSDWYTFCLSLGDTYQLQDNDVVAVRYPAGNSTNAVRVQVSSEDRFDSTNTQFTQQAVTGNTWTNTGTSDMVMKIYLRGSGVTTTEQTFKLNLTSTTAPELTAFLLILAMLFMFIGVIIQLNKW